jgi:hypothetical protein
MRACRRARLGAGRRCVRAQPGVEPNPGEGPGSDQRIGAGRAGTVAAASADALDRCEEVLCVAGFCLSLRKTHDLITSPAFIVMKAATEFQGQDDDAEAAMVDRLRLSRIIRLPSRQSEPAQTRGSSDGLQPSAIHPGRRRMNRRAFVRSALARDRRGAASAAGSGTIASCSIWGRCSTAWT